MSSMPPGVTSDPVSGSGIEAAWPPAPYSNERKSGSMSSQFDKRPEFDGAAGVSAERSGAKKGFASWACLTDFGTTCLATSGATVGASVTMSRSSGSSSAPEASNMSRRSALAASLTLASGASKAMSEVSRAAVLAMMPARPSSRLSTSARSLSGTSRSSFTRARSSRTSRAAT